MPMLRDVLPGFFPGQDLDEFMTSREISQLLGIQSKSVLNMTYKGHFPEPVARLVSSGHGWLWRRSDVASHMILSEPGKGMLTKEEIVEWLGLGGVYSLNYFLRTYGSPGPSQRGRDRKKRWHYTVIQEWADQFIEWEEDNGSE